MNKIIYKTLRHMAIVQVSIQIPRAEQKLLNISPRNVLCCMKNIRIYFQGLYWVQLPLKYYIKPLFHCM